MALAELDFNIYKNLGSSNIKFLEGFDANIAHSNNIVRKEGVGAFKGAFFTNSTFGARLAPVAFAIYQAWVLLALWNAVWVYLGLAFLAEIFGDHSIARPASG